MEAAPFTAATAFAFSGGISRLAGGTRARERLALPSYSHVQLAWRALDEALDIRSPAECINERFQRALQVAQHERVAGSRVRVEAADRLAIEENARVPSADRFGDRCERLHSQRRAHN